MYPHLSPHGLIMKLDAKPMARIREDVVRKDQECWKRLTAGLVGDVITEKSTIKETCDFAEKIYLRKDLKEFKRDSGFAKNSEAQKTFSQLRSSIGGIYAWRAGHSEDADERERMRKAADISFRQAFVLCPYSPEAIFRYTQLLVNRSRYDDAISVVNVAMRLTDDDSQFKDLLRTLREHAR